MSSCFRIFPVSNLIFNLASCCKLSGVVFLVGKEDYKRPDKWAAYDLKLPFWNLKFLRSMMQIRDQNPTSVIGIWREFVSFGVFSYCFTLARISLAPLLCRIYLSIFRRKSQILFLSSDRWAEMCTLERGLSLRTVLYFWLRGNTNDSLSTCSNCVPVSLLTL